MESYLLEKEIIVKSIKNHVMNREDFIDVLHQMRIGKGNYSIAFQLYHSTEKILEESPELVEVIFNDLALSICKYAEGDISVEVMAAEQSLYTMEKAVNFTGYIPLIKKFLSIMEDLSKVDMVYDGTARTIIAEYILQKTEEFEKLLGEYPLRYDEVKATLVAKYPWLNNE